jgi:hypothetical protein
MRWQSIFSIVGFMLVLCGFMMTLPAVLDWFYKNTFSATSFLASAALTVSLEVFYF